MSFQGNHCLKNRRPALPAPLPPKPEDKLLGVYQTLNVYLKKGPYGYYVQWGDDATALTEKPKRVALPKFIKPEDLTFEEAQTLISLPKDLGDGIEVNIGKFGPYIKQGLKSKSLTGADTIFNITKERAEEILGGVKAKAEPAILGKNPKTNEDIILATGRYGLYIKCGKTNYAIPPKQRKPDLSLDEALKIISAEK